MLRLAIQGEAALEVSDLELLRQGACYTIDTVECLAPAEVAWVIGADMLAQLPQWRRAPELAAKVEFIVAVRAPWDVEQSLAAARQALGGALRATVLDTPRIDIASSDIRARVRDGRSIRYLVPPAVEQYVLTHRLYG
jgi:nicotinate-nucleotide adenylyltransferase